MFRIGDFSQLGQVSVCTLRHYGELGLLEPAAIDEETDYRYYTVEQLPRLHRIVALKDSGLSLREITDLLEQNVSARDLMAMLERKQVEVTHKLEEERARLPFPGSAWKSTASSFHAEALCIPRSTCE